MTNAAVDDYKAIADRLRELLSESDQKPMYPVIALHCQWCNLPMALGPTGMRCLRCDSLMAGADAG